MGCSCFYAHRIAYYRFDDEPARITVRLTCRLHYPLQAVHLAVSSWEPLQEAMRTRRLPRTGPVLLLAAALCGLVSDAQLLEHLYLRVHTVDNPSNPLNNTLLGFQPGGMGASHNLPGDIRHACVLCAHAAAGSLSIVLTPVVVWLDCAEW